MTDQTVQSTTQERQEQLLEIARCPLMVERLESTDNHACGPVVRHQWPDQVSVEERRERWRREHHLPEPWVGRIDLAPVLFVSSNPNLSSTRPVERPVIEEPQPLRELASHTLAEHASLRYPFRAPKATWDNDAVIDRYENAFEVWMEPSGTRARVPEGARRARKTPFWRVVRLLAQELYRDRTVEPGADYALTEVVHCKSKREAGVADALRPCVERYLERVLAAAVADVVIVLGAQARSAFELIAPGCSTGQTSDLCGKDRTLAFAPHPGWHQWQPQTFDAAGVDIAPLQEKLQ
jgi:hypothetical protein